MSVVKIDCPECAGLIEVEESTFGQRLKCPKCKESFIAERPGLYDIVEDPVLEDFSAPPPPSPAPRGNRPSQGRSTRSSRDAAPEPLSDEKKSELLSSMEKWAEE